MTTLAGTVLNHKAPTFITRTTSTLEKACVRSTSISFSFLPSKSVRKYTQFRWGISSNSSHKSSTNHLFSPETIPLFIYFLIFLFLRFLFTILPLDFPQRWQKLIAFSEEAEVWAKDYPPYLLKAVVAYEDRRFYKHCGIDPVGIARAVLFFPSGGGGSTITQQLVKNTLLKNERSFSRKAIEMLLALILERKLSKSKILISYLSKIYWGHGIYGIKSASNFYFGKSTSLISLGESAMLAGLIPAPELRSPFNDPSRGKSSQARALRRMVEAGFLDIEAALFVVNLPLYLRGDYRICVKFSSLKELCYSGRDGCSSSVKHIWDWERESKLWEVREDMERWAIKMQEKRQSNHSSL